MTARSSTPLSILEEVLSGGQDWLWTAAILALASLPPLALGQSAWIPGIHRLVLLTVPAAALGLALARRRRRRSIAAPLVLGGLLLALLLAADPLAEPSAALERIWQAGRRLYWWATVVWLGGSNDDPLVPTVAAAWLLWLSCLWLGWSQGSGRSVMAGALPVGVVLAANSFFTLGGWAHLVAFVALTMLLLALGHSRGLQASGDHLGSASEPGTSAAAVALALPVAAVALALALALPPIASETVADAFWARAERPWRTTVRLVKWLFPGLSPGAASSPWIEDEAGAALPSARDLVQTLAPEETVVMYVHTSDPPPLGGPGPAGDPGLTDLGPKRYWRGMTYDVYTGEGWANSRTDAVRVPAGRGIQALPGPGQQVAQSFQILVPRDELTYVLAEPLSLGDEVRAHWRGEGDLAYLKAPVGGYEAVSLLVEPTAAELRAAGQDYPLEVRDRYLTVPDIPERVQRTALDLATSGDNPYDRLRGLEAYLRANYEYDLAVGEPAPGRDVVDFFLFESRRGFCDHYASAMVVLARLAGIPARLASGYTSGTYDYDRDRFVVRASNAHSWPEAYFPDIGWVAFEPTVTQAPFYRPPGSDGAAAAPVPAPSASAGQDGSTLPWLVAGATLAAGLAAWWVWRRRLPSDPVLRAYWSMELAGARLGVGNLGATPREYALLVARRVGELQPAVSDGVDGTAAALREVALAYEERRYRPDRPATAGLTSAWRRAEGVLWLLAAKQLPRAVAAQARRRWRDWSRRDGRA